MSSNSSLFSVENPDEPWALWRLVFDAKFQTELRDSDLFGSPFVEALAKRIDEAMLRSYRLQGKSESVELHRQWRKSLPQNLFVLHAVTARLKEDGKSKWWNSQSHDSKIAYVRGRLVPFEPTDDMLEKLVQQVDTHACSSI